MLTAKDTIRSLKRQIEGKMISSDSGRFFLPDFYLRTILTFEKIKDAVGELQCATYERIDLAKKIDIEAIRIFAILIKCGEQDSIISFREHDISDTSLPLSADLATQIMGQFGISFANEYQWQFLPFKFRKGMSDYPAHIDDRRILPFLSSSVVSSGSFGDVSMVNVFPLLQEFVPVAVSHGLFMSRYENMNTFYQRIQVLMTQ